MLWTHPELSIVWQILFLFVIMFLATRWGASSHFQCFLLLSDFRRPYENYHAFLFLQFLKKNIARISGPVFRKFVWMCFDHAFWNRFWGTSGALFRKPVQMDICSVRTQGMLKQVRTMHFRESVSTYPQISIVCIFYTSRKQCTRCFVHCSLQMCNMTYSHLPCIVCLVNNWSSYLWAGESRAR